MKRLSTIQILAGLLLIASWFVYVYLVQPGYYEMEILDIEGNIIAHFGSFSLQAARPALFIWFAGFPLLGILVTGCGTSRLIKNIKGMATRRLDIAQIVFGVLALALMILFVMQVEPPWEKYFPFPDLASFPGAVEVRHIPEWVILMNAWKIVSFSLGPAIAATGIWQTVKRKETGETGL